MTSALALWRAWQTHARGKRRRAGVAVFDLDADRHIFALHRSLVAGSYRPAPHQQHVVYDPKLRLISAPQLRDRVLHQALVTELGPHFERGYIADSYACLPGRGPQRAALRFLKWTRRHRYRMALDIRRYFPSIDHAALLRLLLRRIGDPRTAALLRQLIAAGGEVYRTPLAVEALGLREQPIAAGVGLPIGSCLSQWAANLYLDGLDHFIKRTLKFTGYLRYMDDLTLFADDRARLDAAKRAIAAWLRDERGLELNPKRGQVVSASQPAVFLGIRVSPAGLGPSRKLRRHLAGKLRAAARRPAALIRCLRSYRGLLTFT